MALLILVPPIQGAIADKFNTHVSYFLIVPAFLYVALWAAWVWNKDGRRFGAGVGEVEREIGAAGGAVVPPAVLGFHGRTEQYEGSIKENLERVEKV